MIPMPQVARIQIKQSDGTWVSALFSQLEPGDVFRELCEDGSVRRDAYGRTEFEVLTHPVVEVKPPHFVPYKAPANWPWHG